MTFKAVSKEATKLTVSFSKPPAPSVEVRHLTNLNKSGFIWNKIRTILQFHHRIFVTCFYHHKSPKPKFPSVDKGSMTLLKACTCKHKNVWSFNSNLIYSGLNWQDFFICQDFLIYQQQSMSNNSVLRVFYLRWLHTLLCAKSFHLLVAIWH